MGRALSALLAALLLFVAALPAHAFDDSEVARIEASIKTARETLTGIVSAIDPNGISNEAIAQNRTNLAKLKSDVEASAKQLDQPQTDVSAQITQLGPPPEDGSTEPEAVAQQRKTLNDRATQLLGLRKQLELVSIEADQQLSRLSTIERDQFLNRVFAYERSALDPRLWWNAVTSGGQFFRRTGNLLAQWWKQVSPEANFAVLGAVAVTLAFMMFLIARLSSLFRGILSPDLGEGGNDPAAASQVRRLWHAIFNFLRWSLGAFLAVWIVMIGLDASGAMTAPFRLLIESVAETVLLVFVYGGAAYMICQPTKPEARLVAVDSAAARSLVLITALASFIYGAGTALTDIASELSIPVNFAVGVSALSAVGLVLLIGLGLIIIRTEERKGLAQSGTTYFLIWILKFTPFIWLLLAVSVISLAFGFIALALFIGGNILESAMLAVILGVLHAFAHAIADAAGNPETRTGKLFQRVTYWSDEGMRRSILVFRTIVDIGTSFAAILGLGALWAVSLVDFTTLVSSAAGGFQVGNISISPGSLLAALLILLIGVVITRYITSWLQGRVLSATKLDKGAQDSIRTTAGYAGYAVAASIALSAAGVSFSNLALIAGALGLGIGLGVQQIVTNFISGLILLAERPIRIGDWVVTTGGEGIVKRINVRATEIETFDRSSIIIPNSNFIINPVRNWTLRDTIGHFSIPVSVSYDGDPDVIAKTLLDIAAGHPKMMRHPGPDVSLVKLTPQAMEFEVGGQLRNVMDAAGVTSELRMEIVRRLGKKLLHIPAGQGGKAVK